MRRGSLWLLVLVGGISFPPSAPAAPDVSVDERTLQEARVGIDGPSLLDFLRKRTASDGDLQQIQTLVRDLGHRSFSVRESAVRQLADRGTLALQFLRPALASTDPEVSRRAASCAALIQQAANAGLPAAAARLLAARKPAGAAEVLLGYLPFADNDWVSDEVRAALGAVVVQDGKPVRAVVQSLEHAMPIRRAAAAEALCRAGVRDHHPAIRKLLRDQEPLVRLRVGLALAEAQEREAVPVLIALLTELPRERVWSIEEVLFALARESAPKETVGDDPAAARKCRDAWAAWWEKNGKDADLLRLTAAQRLLGLTLVLEFDGKNGQGRALELGPDRKPRWQFAGMDNSVDARILNGNRILIAEHGKNQVTERNFDGKILWQKQLPAPILSQRLSSGNTFIVTMSRMIEVDRKGTEVFTWSRTGIRAAYKHPNGQIGVVTSDQNYRLLDPTGKELKTFRIQVSGNNSIGGIDFLRGGGLVVSQVDKVVEYNADGKIIWQAPVKDANCVTRLPNGHTLVASLSGRYLLEMDRAGKEVWKYTSPGGIWLGRRR